MYRGRARRREGARRRARPDQSSAVVLGHDRRRSSRSSRSAARRSSRSRTSQFTKWNLGDKDHPSTEALWDDALGRGAHDVGRRVRRRARLRPASAARQVAAGGGWVVVKARRDPQAIVDALAAGHFYASTGVVLDARGGRRRRARRRGRADRGRALRRSRGSRTASSSRPSTRRRAPRVAGDRISARRRHARRRQRSVGPARAALSCQSAASSEATPEGVRRRRSGSQRAVELRARRSRA